MDPSIAGFYPFVGYLAWPALERSLLVSDIERAKRLTGVLLLPQSQRLPDDVVASLRQFEIQPAEPALSVALAWARTMNFV